MTKVLFFSKNVEFNKSWENCIKKHFSKNAYIQERSIKNGSIEFSVVWLCILSGTYWNSDFVRKEKIIKKNVI